MEKYTPVAPVWMCIKRPSMSAFALAKVKRCKSDEAVWHIYRGPGAIARVPTREQSPASGDRVDRRVLDAGVQRAGARRLEVRSGRW